MSRRPLFTLSARDRASIASHLARSAARGEPLRDALALLAGGPLSGTARRHCALLAERVAAGARLSEAMADFPRSFPPAIVGLVAAGEASGRVGCVLEAWELLDRQRWRLRRTAVPAAAYPVLVLATTAALGGLLASTVAPTFAAILRTGELPVPLSLRILDLGAPHRDDSLIRFVVLPLVFITLPALRRLVDRMTLAIPVVRRFARQRSACVTLAVTAAFVAAGRGLDEALRAAADAQPNGVMARATRSLASEVASGAPLPSSSPALDAATLQALRGALLAADPAAATARLARREAESFERRHARLLTLLPHALVLVAAAFCGAAVIATYDLMFHMATAIP